MSRPTFTAAPRLETERLVLRAHRVDDLDACFAMWSDPEVVRHIGGRPSTREETWARLLRYAGHWALLGFGYWAIEEKAGARFAGELGLANFMRQLEPPLEQPESGWALARWAHGRGYATEALRAVLAWSDAHLGPRTVCLIDPGNLASIRVAEKCGYRRTRETSYKGAASIIFER